MYRKKSILVVDDDRLNLMVARSVLSEEYKVVDADSGETALLYLSGAIPDLVLLDIVMPGMSGLEVMKEMKGKEEWKEIPVIFLTAERSADTENECFTLGASDFINKPFVPKVMLNRIRKTLELQDYRKNLEFLAQKQAQRIMEQERRLLEIQQEVIVSMANLIESRDGTTGEHVKRTSRYVGLLAEELQRKGLFHGILSDSYIRNLSRAAPLHDIGKITVPDYILKKPGRLSEEEFEIMKTHAPEGGRIIRDNMGKIEEEEYIQIATDVATYHHEKWDGSGYPEGRRGDDIPLAARIMALTDVFDALTSERCYKKKMGVEESFHLMKDLTGSHFDPQIARVFLGMRSIWEYVLENTSLPI